MSRSRCLSLVVATLLAGCASLAPMDKPQSHALPASPATPLGALAVHGTAFRPLPFSAFSMDARLALARTAVASLDVQYYLLQNDATGRTLLRALRDAAERGVRVRILVDDLYTAQSDRLLTSLAATPNVEIRLFNPFPAGRGFAATRWAFSLLDFARVNHRMHNKLFIADGAFAVAGGRNIADEYFFHSRTGNFVDFDLLVAGDAVPRLAALFDAYWNSPRVYVLDQLEKPRDPPDARRAAFETVTADAEAAFPALPDDAVDALGYRPLSHNLAARDLPILKGTVDAFADDPEKVSGRSERGDDPSTVTSRVLAAIAGARSDVLLVSPYFVPNRAAMDVLAAVCARGVRVTLVTNTLAANDEPYASVAYGRYRKELLAMGVTIDEISSTRLKLNHDVAPVLKTTIGRSHAKLLVIDDRTTFVGSMNMDLRSSRENTEIGLLVDSRELAADARALVDGIRATGAYRLRLEPDGKIAWIVRDGDAETVLTDEPEVTLGTRLKAIFLSPLIPDGLL